MGSSPKRFVNCLQTDSTFSVDFSPFGLCSSLFSDVILIPGCLAVISTGAFDADCLDLCIFERLDGDDFS